MSGRRSAFVFFNEKFEANLPTTINYQQAYEKAEESVGYSPFKNYESFRVVRSRRRHSK